MVMNAWQIIVIILCVLIYFFVLLGEYTDIITARKRGRKLHRPWSHILKILFAPLFFLWVIVTFPWWYCKDYLEKLNEHGGYKCYKKWRKEEKIREKEREKEWQAKKVEYDRIAEAYKRNELRRDELPRSQDGIKHFEFYGEILSDDWRDLVYIENEYNNIFNNFFKRHPLIQLKHNIRVIYIPQLIQGLTNGEVLKYWNPSLTEKPLNFPVIDTSTLLKEVCYPEDKTKLSHGLVSCSGWSYNHDAKYLHATYYALEENDDNNILQQIETIAKEAFSCNAGGLYSTVSRPSKEKKTSKNYADEQFGWEIYSLIDEIRDRVEILEQRGISRKLLKKLLDEKRKLSRLVITKDMRIILPDYTNIEIKMEPLNKAVFLLFLRHPEGIIFKHLPDYRNELAEIYQKIKPLGLNDRAIQSIEDVTNPCLNSINEKCARIRGAFISQFDDDLAKHYYIDGMRGEAKKISLPRDLVVWEN